MRLVLPATDHAVRRSLINLKTSLSTYQLSEPELASFEIVMAEILNNIVEHAYIGRNDGTIEISLSMTNAGLWCFVEDNGVAMPNGTPPMGAQVEPDCAVSDLPEGGFGWFLIREIAHDLTYERVGDHNRLTFRLTVEHTGK